MSTTEVADEAQTDTETEDREGRSGAPRPEKVQVVDEVREQLSSNPATLLTEYRGLSVSELAELRAALRDANADYVVVKNTLARIAARDAGFEGLIEHLTGPTALTYCSDDPVGPAKALRQFAKDHPELVVKGGILEGRVVDAETADKLADLESREDLLARFAQLMYGALANTATLLEAPLSKMARLLAAYQEEGDLPEGEAPAAAEEPEATDEPEAADEQGEAEEAEEPEATEEPEAADEQGEAEEAEEPEATEAEAADDAEDADETDEDAGIVEAVADTAADAVETAAEATETAVETAAETAKDVADDTPVETPVDVAAETTEAVAEAATDTVEDAAETAADAVSSSDDEDEDEETEQDEEDDEQS